MNAVLEQTLTAAKNVDIYNGSFISEDADLQNGSVFTKGEEYSEQVYKVEAPAGNGLWMASSPVDTILTDATGNQYKPGILDPRAFTNPKGLVFSAFKPQVGDIITISADGIEGDYTEGSTTHVNAADGEHKLAFDTSAGTDTLSFKVIKPTYISVASANAIGSQRIVAYKLECIAN